MEISHIKWQRCEMADLWICNFYQLLDTIPWPPSFPPHPPFCHIASQCLLKWLYTTCHASQFNTSLPLRGPFGVVHRAVERATGRNFAAKFIDVEPKDKALLKEEMEVMGNLQHPRLQRLHDAFDQDDDKVVLILDLWVIFLFLLICVLLSECKTSDIFCLQLHRSCQQYVGFFFFLSTV